MTPRLLAMALGVCASVALGAAKSPAAAGPKARVGEASFEALKQNFGALEYDAVIDLAEKLLRREDLTPEQRLDVYEYQGSALAVVRDPVDAEQPFRLLLRADPNRELTVDRSPKIVAIFKKIQLEERAVKEQLATFERKKTIAGLKLLNPAQLPTQAAGGKVLAFSIQLRDPLGSVENVRVPYRRAGQPQFSVLALERGPSGAWQASLPAESTASPSGFSLQYFVETRDARGPLLTVGSEAAPLVVEVLPGQVPAQVFKPVPKAVFFGAVGVTGASALAVAGLSVALNLTQSRYQTLANGPAPHTVFDTEALVGLGRTGSALAVATNVALVAVSVSMLTTLILGILTKFDE